MLTFPYLGLDKLERRHFTENGTFSFDFDQFFSTSMSLKVSFTFLKLIVCIPPVFCVHCVSINLFTCHWTKVKAHYSFVISFPLHFNLQSDLQPNLESELLWSFALYCLFFYKYCLKLYNINNKETDIYALRVNFAKTASISTKTHFTGDI